MESLSPRIIVTGGTFDKVYDPIKGNLTFDTSHIETIIKVGKVNHSPKIDIPFLVDSLDMTETQREEVISIAESCPEEHIIITHGTDTMIDTAQQLLFTNIKKTIILTGAMTPFRLDASDATFNLGFAFAACQYVKQGVYIAMNGQLFNPTNCIKDRSKGLFKEIN